MGRIEGYRKSALQYQIEYAYEISLIEKGYSLRQIRRLTGRAINTIRKLRNL